MTKVKPPLNTTSTAWRPIIANNKDFFHFISQRLKIQKLTGTEVLVAGLTGFF
jgi:hypothetical protein